MGDLWPARVPVPMKRDPAPGILWLCVRRQDTGGLASESSGVLCFRTFQTAYLSLRGGLSSLLQKQCEHVEHLMLTMCTMCACKTEVQEPWCTNHRCCPVPVDHPHLRDPSIPHPRVHFISCVTSVLSGTIIQDTPGHIEHQLFTYHSGYASAWEMARLLYYSVVCAYGKYRNYDLGQYVLSCTDSQQLRWQIPADYVRYPDADPAQPDRMRILNTRLQELKGREDFRDESPERILTMVMMDALGRALAKRDGTGDAGDIATDEERVNQLVSRVSRAFSMYKGMSEIEVIERRRLLRKGALTDETQEASFVCAELVLNALQFAGIVPPDPIENPSVVDPGTTVRIVLGSGRMDPNGSAGLMQNLLSWDRTLAIPVRKRIERESVAFQSI